MNINSEIIESAIAFYGDDAQLDQTIEECLELSLAIRKYKRAVKYNYTDEIKSHKKNDVIDEIADVIIMCVQAATIVGVENVQKRIDFKIDRLSKRISE